MTDQQKLAGKVAVATVVTPGPGALNWRDIGKGALYAVAAAVIPLIQQAISSNAFDWKLIGGTAISTLVGYLMVKFFGPTQQITTFKKNQP